MKKTLFLASLLLSSLMCQQQASAAGGIVFVGDSITQGGSFNNNLVASYRYALFKHYVDSDLTYNPMGMTNGASGGTNVTSKTPDYRGVSFTNVSEAAASGRSYQYSGHASSGSLRADPNTVLPAANRGPVYNKLGLTNPYTNSKTTYYNGSTLTNYTGETYMSRYGTELPETLCIMIGVNDIYDTQGGSATAYALPSQSTINYVKEIVQAYQQYNPDIKVVVMGILPTGSNNNSYNYTAAYNALLEPQVSGWSTATSNVQYADVSEGFYAKNGAMIDGVAGAHPNAQGELIVAGNLARVLGLEQRTAGLTRKATGDMATQVSLNSITPVATTTASNGSTSTRSFAHASTDNTIINNTWSTKSTTLGNSLVMTSAKGVVADSLKMTWTNGTSPGRHESAFSFTVKMDAIDTLSDTSNYFSVFYGNGSDQVGVLRVGENGIWWGLKDNASLTLLYGAPNKADGTGFMTTDFHNITICFKIGSVASETGYYIWLDDQLIGEALSGYTNLAVYNDTILFGKQTFSDAMYGEISNISFSADIAFAPISLSPVPEPGTATLGVLSLGFFFLNRRSRRTSKV